MILKVFIKLDAIKRKGHGKEEVTMKMGITSLIINNDVFMEVFMTEDELREWEESNAAGMVMGGR